MLQARRQAETVPPQIGAEPHYLPYSDEGVTLNEQRQTLPRGILVECSTDMQYLNQYYFIREYLYRTELKVLSFNGAEDEIDRRSHIIIARVGHFCIGGLRITISKRNHRMPINIERDGFDIRDQLPFLNDHDYCDVGRAAVLPEYRHANVIAELFRVGIAIGRKHGCTYLLGGSPPTQARLFHRISKDLVKHSELRPDIRLPMGKENSHLKLMFQLYHI